MRPVITTALGSSERFGPSSTYPPRQTSPMACTPIAIKSPPARYLAIVPRLSSSSRSSSTPAASNVTPKMAKTTAVLTHRERGRPAIPSASPPANTSSAIASSSRITPLDIRSLPSSPSRGRSCRNGRGTAKRLVAGFHGCRGRRCFTFETLIKQRHADYRERQHDRVDQAADPVDVAHLLSGSDQEHETD